MAIIQRNKGTTIKIAVLLVAVATAGLLGYLSFTGQQPTEASGQEALIVASSLTGNPAVSTNPIMADLAAPSFQEGSGSVDSAVPVARQPDASASSASRSPAIAFFIFYRLAFERRPDGRFA